MPTEDAPVAAEITELPAEPRGVFGGRNFRLLFFGQLISNSGTWLQNAAQGVLVLKLSGSPLMVGVTTAAMFFPVIPLALLGGKLADRFDRKRLLVGTQVVALSATGILAILAATGRATVAAVLVVALVVGAQYAVSIPATFALLPSLVERDQLGQAIGANSITYNVARVAGPLISTAAITAIGFGFAFGLNSLSFLALIVALLYIRPREVEGTGESVGSIGEGVAYAWRTKRVRLMLLGVVVGAAALDPAFTLAPVFAERVFGHPAADGGILMAAFGTGAILSGVVSSRAFRGTPRFRLLMPTMLVFAAGLTAFLLSPGFWPAVPALFVAGIGSLLAMIIWTTGIQHEVPEAFRGRVMGLWTLAFLGTRTFAGLLSGALADSLGPRSAVLVLMVPLVLVALLVAPRLARFPAT